MIMCKAITINRIIIIVKKNNNRIDEEGRHGNKPKQNIKMVCCYYFQPMYDCQFALFSCFCVCIYIRKLMLKLLLSFCLYSFNGRIPTVQFIYIYM